MPAPLDRLRAWVREKDASFFFYFAARLLSGVLGIVTIRWVVAFLPREEYGEWGYLNVIGSMLVPVVTLALPQAMMRMYFDHREDAVAAQRSLVSSVALANLLGAVALGAAALLGWALGIQRGIVALFLGVVVTGRVAASFTQYLTRTRNDYGLFFFVTVFEPIVYLGFLVAAGAWLGVSPQPGGARLGWLTGCLGGTVWFTASVAALYYVRRGLISATARRYGRADYRALLAYSLPLIPTFFLGWALSSSDIWVLRRLSTLGETADYVFATKIVSVVALVQQSALVDWPRFYYAKMRDGGPERDAAIATRARKFLLLHVATVLGTRLVATHAYSLFGADEYRAGLDYLGWLMLGNYAFLLGNLFSAGIGYAKRTRLVLVTFLVPGALNVGANLLVVPRWGARGAAFTTVGAYAIFALLSLLIGQRFHRFAGLGWIVAITALAVGASLVPL